MAKNQISYGYARKEGYDWLRNNQQANATDIEARTTKYRNAWGDDLAQQFWGGIQDAKADRRKAFA